MNSVKIVLSNGEDDEYELGTYNQGILFEIWNNLGPDVVDIASGYIVMQKTSEGWRWGEIGPYSHLFVHAVEQTVNTGNVHLVELEPFSTRTHNLLRRYRYETLEDVCEESERYMRSLPGIGDTIIEEIRMSLTLYELDFAPIYQEVQPTIETVSRPVGRQKIWTKEKIDEAIQVFVKEHGRLPKASEWRLTDGSHPSTNAVQNSEYGSWNAAMEANGTARSRGFQREEK